MPCYSPIRAVLQGRPDRRRLSFKSNASGEALGLPCGRCVGCRLERARQWSVRLMHESVMHEDSVFLTLTFNEESVPDDGSLSISVCQLFLKRLRARVAPARIRHFLAGEYGGKHGRPHYHAIIFGFGFPDRVPMERSDGGDQLYRSALLESCWKFGYSSIGSVTFESANYVAQYHLKKVTGKKAAAFYEGRQPEFVIMSRNPGIGRSWIEKFESDVYPSDEVIVRGLTTRPPRYYDQVFKKKFPEKFEELRLIRIERAQQLDEIVLKSGLKLSVPRGTNARRLQIRERVAQAKLKLKKDRSD